MPTLLYNLELTEEEMLHLFALLSIRTARKMSAMPFDQAESSMLEKVVKLMEGR
jgi:hypothetical protein